MSDQPPMKILYADYTDGTHLERAVPANFTLWPDAYEPNTSTANVLTAPVARIAWATPDYEAWLDTEGLRFIAICTPPVAPQTHETVSEGELQQLIANANQKADTKREPAILEGGQAHHEPVEINDGFGI